jgi:MYXO-CTERM domain-containing protein
MGLSLPSLAVASTGEDQEPLIYGGVDAQTCEWPSAANLQGNCSATLIHPEVLIYAAHCGAGYSTVRFTEDINGNGGKAVATEYCQTFPEFGDNSLGQGIDFAFCKMAEPVTGVPVVPMLMGCETQILAPGQMATLVGYGVADTGPYGVKRIVEVPVNGVTNEASLGGGGPAGCNGDSGGPAYIKLGDDVGGDGTWRAFGIASYIVGECGQSPTFYSLMHLGVEWVEESVGIDITPCHDADGTWNPGPECRSFPQEPGTGLGGWGSGCGIGPVGGWSDICGDPYGEPDETPPTVSITAPETGASFDTEGGSAMITIVAQAADDDFGVSDVRLTINGDELEGATDWYAPYEWPGQFNAGQYTVTAIARDYAGNEAESEPVYFGVDMDAPEPPQPEDTGDTGDTDTDDGGTDDESGANDDSGKGCGCSTTGDGRGAALGMGLLLLAGWRRRR